MSQLAEFMDALKNTTIEFAQTLPPDGDWEPMLFITKDEKVYMAEIPMPDNGPARERLWQTVIPNSVKHVVPEPDMVMICVQIPGAGQQYVDDGLMPSESPHRHEAVVIQGVSKEEEITYFAEIKRGGEHPELEWITEGGMEGRALASLRRAVWE